VTAIAWGKLLAEPLELVIRLSLKSVAAARGLPQCCVTPSPRLRVLGFVHVLIIMIGFSTLADSPNHPITVPRVGSSWSMIAQRPMRWR